MPPIKNSPHKTGKSMLFFTFEIPLFSVMSINSQIYMTKPKQAQKTLSENTGKTFSLIMPPFSSKGGGHNYGNDCTKMVALLLKCKCETRANIFIFKCGSPTNQKHGHVVSGWLQQTAAAQNSWKLRDSCRLHKQTKGGLVFGIQEATSSANNKHPSAERWVSNLAASREISISLFCPNFRCASISSTYPGLSVSLSQGCTSIALYYISLISGLEI